MHNHKSTQNSEFYQPIGKIYNRRPHRELPAPPPDADIFKGVQRCVLKEPFVRELGILIRVNECLRAVIYTDSKKLARTILAEPGVMMGEDLPSEDTVKSVTRIITAINAFFDTIVLFSLDEVNDPDLNLDLEKDLGTGWVTYPKCSFRVHDQQYLSLIRYFGILKYRLQYFLDLRLQELQNPALMDTNFQFRYNITKTFERVGEQVKGYEEYYGTVCNVLMQRAPGVYKLIKSIHYSTVSLERINKEVNTNLTDWIGTYNQFIELGSWNPFKLQPAQLPTFPLRQGPATDYKDKKLGSSAVMDKLGAFWKPGKKGKKEKEKETEWPAEKDGKYGSASEKHGDGGGWPDEKSRRL